MKQLKEKYLVKAVTNYLKMFKEQDEYYPDYRKVRTYEYHYWNDLKKVTPIEEEQKEVNKIIESYIFSPTKSIAEALQEKGYTIVKE